METLLHAIWQIPWEMGLFEEARSMDLILQREDLEDKLKRKVIQL